jgi:hypothetical protein
MDAMEFVAKVFEIAVHFFFFKRLAFFQFGHEFLKYMVKPFIRICEEICEVGHSVCVGGGDEV